MSGLAGRLCGVLMALAATAAAFRCGRQYQGRALLAQAEALESEPRFSKGGDGPDGRPAGDVRAQDAAGDGAASTLEAPSSGPPRAQGAEPARGAAALAGTLRTEARIALLQRAFSLDALTPEAGVALAFAHLRAASERALAAEDPSQAESADAPAGDTSRAQTADRTRAPRHSALPDGDQPEAGAFSQRRNALAGAAGAAKGAREQRHDAPAQAPDSPDVIHAHLRSALASVLAALAANPLDTQAWLAGYRTIESARTLGAARALAGSEERLSDLSTRLVEGAIATDPQGGDFHRRLGALMLTAGDRPGALAHFRHASRDLAADALGIATALLDAGFPPADVLSAMPERFDAQYGAGQLLLARSHAAAAEQALRRAAALNPAAWQVWTSLSRLAQSQDRHAQALGFARSAFPFLDAAGPVGRAEVLFCAALASRSLGDLDSAVSYARRAISDNPTTLFPYHFLASVLYEKGDAAGSIPYWQALVAEHGNDPYVVDNGALFHRLMGRSYEKLGNRRRAIDSYLEALRAAPGDAEARAALKKLR